MKRLLLSLALGGMMVFAQSALAVTADQSASPTPTPTPRTSVSPARTASPSTSASPKTVSTATPVARTTPAATAKPSATAVASPKPSATLPPRGTPTYTKAPLPTATPSATVDRTSATHRLGTVQRPTAPTATPLPVTRTGTPINIAPIQGKAIDVTSPTPAAAPGSSVSAGKIGGVPGGGVSGNLVVAPPPPRPEDKYMKVTGIPRTFKQPSQVIKGQLLCPKIGPGAKLEVGCQASGFGLKFIPQSIGKATLFGASNGTDCSAYKRVGGLGGVFWDPREGGQCWACPVLLHRSIHAVDQDDACTAGNDDAIVWQSAQYPDPGIAAFITPEIVSIAFSNTAFVDAFLTKRAGYKLSKQKMWEQMSNSPNDSPEFKALIFSAILFVAQQDPKYQTQASDSVSIFESYIKQRRGYIASDAIDMYEKYLDLNAYKQNQGTKNQLLGGGPLGYISKGTGMIITSPGAALSGVIGISPEDYVSAAYGAATPDSRGEDFVRALVDLNGTDYEKAKVAQTGPDLVEWAALGVSIVDSTARMHDVLEASHMIKGIGFLEGQGGINFTLGLNMVGGALDFVAAVMTLHEQEEAQQQYDDLAVEANKDVSIAEILKSGSDQEKNSLLMWWSLATSPYKPSDTVGKNPINSWDVCQAYPSQCADIKRIVSKAMPPPPATPPPPVPAELVVQIDATKSLAQLLSGINSAASATAAKSKITAAVTQVNQAAANVKKLTGPAWGAANLYRADLDKANAQVKKEVTRIKALPDAYPVIQGALAPLNLALPGGRAPSD